MTEYIIGAIFLFAFSYPFWPSTRERERKRKEEEMLMYARAGEEIVAERERQRKEYEKTHLTATEVTEVRNLIREMRERGRKSS